jgi:hypothetical protein
MEIKQLYYTVEYFRKWTEIAPYGFSINIPGGEIRAIDTKSSNTFQEYVPVNTPIKVVKAKGENGIFPNEGNVVICTIPLNELLQKGSVQIMDESSKAQITLKGVILYGTMVRITLSL